MTMHPRKQHRSNFLARSIALALTFLLGSPAALAEEDEKKKKSDEAQRSSNVEANSRAQTKNVQDSLPDIGGAAQGPNKAKEAADSLTTKAISAAQSAAKSSSTNTSASSTSATDQFKTDVANAAISSGLSTIKDSDNQFLQRLDGGITLGSEGDVDVNLKTMGMLYGGEDKRHYLLTQFGVHNEGDRATANVGLVYRWIAPGDTWLLGANVFYDHDFDNGAHRVGLGVEAATQSLRFFANTYAPASDAWKTIDEAPDFEERAASGYDLGLTWSPTRAPGLDLTVKGSRWHGDQVDVFGTGQTYKDPFVLTTKVSYSPVPLFGIALEHDSAMGTGTRDTRVSFNFKYQLNESLGAQKARKNVAQKNDIRQRATDFVERENKIITEIREKDVPLAFVGPSVVNDSVMSDAIYSYQLQVIGAKEGHKFTLAGPDAALFTLVGNELRLDPTKMSSADLAKDNRFEATVNVVDGRGRVAQQHFIIDVIDIDPDGDGLSNEQEEHHGTDPNKPDTDADGIDDKTEVDSGTNPLDPNDPGTGNTPTGVEVHFNGSPLSGAPIVGSVLNASVTCAGGGKCTTPLVYQWQIESAVGSGTYIDIPGAVAETYTVTRGDQKRRIRVLATKP
ncbi:ZirU family protein [Lysobacter sp. 2RAF19]